MELEQVVTETDQGPLLLDALKLSAQELPKAARMFDLPEDRFDDGLPSGVQALPSDRRQRALHPLLRAPSVRRPAARRHGRRLRALSTPRGNSHLTDTLG